MAEPGEPPPEPRPAHATALVGGGLASSAQLDAQRAAQLCTNLLSRHRATVPHVGEALAKVLEVLEGLSAQLCCILPEPSESEMESEDAQKLRAPCPPQAARGRGASAPRSRPGGWDLHSARFSRTSSWPSLPASHDALGGEAPLPLQYEDSESLHREALGAIQVRHGKGDIRTAKPKACVAAALGRQGRHKEARPLLEECVEMEERTFGVGHHRTHSSLLSLGSVYAAMNELTEAEPLLLRAAEAAERHHGHDHPHAQLARRRLWEVQAARRRAGRSSPGRGRDEAAPTPAQGGKRPPPVPE